MHPRLVSRLVGLFALLFATTLLVPLGIGWLDGEPELDHLLLPLAGSAGVGLVLSVIAMILGRLEIFTMLVLLSPAFRRG